MALVFARTAVVPVWILVFGVVCLFSPPMQVGTGILLLVGDALVAVIVTDTTTTPVTMRPARAFFSPPLPNRRSPPAKVYSESC